MAFLSADAGGLSAVPGGYFGRALVVELDDGSSSVLELPEPVLRAYLGGSGLGTWLMHRLAPPGVDPLSRRPPWRSCSPRWWARR